MTTSNIIVLSAFAVYMLIMIVIGVIYSRKTKNNEDYFLGGRNLGGWTAALSAQASDMSGWMLMGLPGAVYLWGTGEIWIAIGLLIGTIINWFIVSSRLRKYTIVAGNSLTIPSFFQNRYRDKHGIIKIVAAVIIAIFFTVYTASAFNSGAKLFSTLFGKTTDGSLDRNMYLIGLIIAASVILIYTFLGGFKAVCTTDFIQGLMMIIAILSVPIIAYGILTWNTGFADSLVAKGVENPDSYMNFFIGRDGKPITFVEIVSNIGWGLGYCGMPHILVRFMAIKNEKEVKKSRRVAIVWVVISLLMACFMGLVARGYITEILPDKASAETSFIRMISQLFSGNGVLIFIGGIFLCGILAAIMSTADSQLLVTSSAISEDIFKFIFDKITGAFSKKPEDKKDKKDQGANLSKTRETAALWIGRGAVVLIAIIAFIIALNPNSSIMDLVSDAWAGFGAAFGPVVLLALFWKRSTLPGAISGMAVGAVTVIFWDYITVIPNSNPDLFDGAKFITLYQSTGLYSLVLGFFLALAVNLIVSLCTKKPSKEIIDEFDSIKTLDI